MKTFNEWIGEMCGTGAVYDGSGNGKDYQWWGTPGLKGSKNCRVKRHKKKKKRHES